MRKQENNNMWSKTQEFKMALLLAIRGKIFPEVREYSMNFFKDIKDKSKTDTLKSWEKIRDELIKEVINKTLDWIEKFIYDQSLVNKVKNQEIVTIGDLKYQHVRAQIFNFWAETQMRLYIDLAELFDKKKREELISKDEKLRNYIKAKAKINIFADYREALKDKRLEKEKLLLEGDLEDEGDGE